MALTYANKDGKLYKVQFIRQCFSGKIKCSFISVPQSVCVFFSLNLSRNSTLHSNQVALFQAPSSNILQDIIAASYS